MPLSANHKSIRTKLTRIIVVTCGAAVLAACVVFAMYDVHVARTSRFQALTTIAELTGTNSTAALTFHDSEAGATILRSLRAEPQILHAVLYLPDGYILAQYESDRESVDFSLPKIQSDSIRLAGDRIHAFHAVILNGHRVGTIYLESNTAALVQRRDGLITMVCVSLLISLVLAQLLGSRLQHVISDPILQLAQTAFTVAIEKNYSVRVAGRSGDEIGFLYDQFNAMLDGIQKRDSELERARMELEQRVAERTAYLNALIETSPLGIVTTDRTGRVRVCNSAFELLFRYSRAEIIDAELDSLVAAPQRVEETADFTRRSEAGEAIRAVTQRRRKDGGLVDVELYGVPLVVGGEQVGQLVLYEDISERKRAEQALREAKEMAESANRAKGDFLANMSHEIRTPMNGIIGMTELALEADLTHEVREYLSMVKSSADSLLSLLNDILDFSKIEAGKFEFESLPFALRESLGQTMKALAHSAHRKGLELAWQVSPDVPEWLLGDCGRLRQVLVNLVGNAIKFTERGEVVVSAALAGMASDHAKLRFTVRDTGIGIPAEKQELIFAAFTQADTSTTRKYGGTGLGLAIVQRLVVMMNGNIKVESRVGQGSTFDFTVSLRLPEKKFVPPSLAEPSILHGLPVLIVDDNRTNRLILAEIFKQWGMRPRLAGSASEALDMLCQEHNGTPFRLAVIDAQMPEIDGFMLAQQITVNDAFSKLAIIMLSSVSQPGDSEKNRRAGIFASLTKPAQPSELLNAILVAVGAPAAPPSTDETVAPPERLGAEPLCVLLAEDNAVNHQLASKLLEKRGHHVVTASNGREALAALERESIDLVLMDVQMPDIDGLEAIRTIREKEKTSGAHIPIISVTAHVMTGDRENCIQAGADEYVSKPLQPAELFGAIERCRTRAAAMQPSARLKSLDAAEILDRCQGDYKLLAEIVELFDTEAQNLLHDVSSAVERNDSGALAKAAHTLKGSIGNFGKGAAYRAAEELEAYARENDLAKARSGLALIEIAVQQLKEDLAPFRKIELAR